MLNIIPSGDIYIKREYQDDLETVLYESDERFYEIQMIYNSYENRIL